MQLNKYKIMEIQNETQSLDIEISVNKIEDIEQHSDRWHELRGKYIGSSEIATVLGLSKYNSIKRLILKKLGYIKEDITDYTAYGHLLEPFVGEEILPYYEEGATIKDIYLNRKEGKKVKNIKKSKGVFVVTFRRGVSEASVIVSPDYYELLPDGTQIPYDIKTTSKFVFDKISDLSIPHDYVWQSVFQQICYSSDEGYVFFMVDREVKSMKVEKKDYIHFFGQIFDALVSFYDNMEAYRKMNKEDVIREIEIDGLFDIKELEEDRENDKEKVIKVGELKDKEHDELGNMYDFISEKVMEYIQFNESKKEMAKKETEIKNIMRQLFYGYDKVVIIDDDNNSKVMTINLKVFNIKVH